VESDVPNITQILTYNNLRTYRYLRITNWETTVHNNDAAFEPGKYRRYESLLTWLRAWIISLRYLNKTKSCQHLQLQPLFP